jgi:hypothetical protein
MSKVKGRSIESQRSSASEKIGFGPPKNGILKGFFAKRGWLLWCKGHQRHYNTLSNTFRECWHSANMGIGAPGLKNS